MLRVEEWWSIHQNLVCLPEKKLPAFPAEEEEMMLFSERVGEAQRLATMVSSTDPLPLELCFLESPSSASVCIVHRK
jgi:hypothetical protein